MMGLVEGDPEKRLLRVSPRKVYLTISAQAGPVIPALSFWCWHSGPSWDSGRSTLAAAPGDVPSPGRCAGVVDRSNSPESINQRTRSRAGFFGAAIASLLFSLSACQPAAPPSQQALPPLAVIAAPAEQRTIQAEAQFVGRVMAVERVELRARVEGFLKERRFQEGQTVARGDLLFVIEPDRYQANVEQRAADLQRAQAEVQNTDAQLARGLELLRQKNVAQARVDELKAAAASAHASLAQAQAALNNARLDLSYTQITAPIAGRIGLAAVSIGNLVGPTSGVLATIVSKDPIYVQFPITQRDLLNARREIKAKGGDPRQVQVQVRLPDGTLYEPLGQLDFVDVTTERATDSVTLRAIFPNPEGTLIDGQYVGVVVKSGIPESAVLIPRMALQVDQQGSYVLIVDADGRAQIRRVVTGQTQGREIVITQGLQAGELVIIEGAQVVRPGQAVRAQPPEALGTRAGA